MEKQPNPPRWADRFLGWLLPSELYEELLGDLHEQFAFQAEEFGAQKARWMYFFEVLRFCRPYFLKRRFRAQSKYSTSYTYSPTMLRNYFKIAWRNLARNKAFSFINLFGLSVGLACFMLIGLFIADELSYDKFYPNANRIYRINSEIKFGGDEMNKAISPDPFGETLKKDYPEVEQYTRIYAGSGNKFIKKGDEFINEQKIVYTDSTFFDIFSLPIVEGNPKTALDKPNTAVISRSGAIKYFGTPNAVGKSLSVNISKPSIYNIVAVYEDIPANAHFHFDVLLSMINLKDPTSPDYFQFGNFLSHSFHTYLRLKKGVDYKDFEKKLPEVFLKYSMPQAKQFLKIESKADFEKAGNKIHYSLIPMTDIHLKSNLQNELGPTGSIQYVYIFGAVAMFLLLIACVNFINLSTARSASRAKEVGIRKTMGTERSTLISQFLSESILTSFIAFGLAIILMAITLPFFNDLSGKKFVISNLFTFEYLPFVMLLPFVVGVLGGYYPAFFLSSFKPIEVLKTSIKTGFSKSNLRNTLVIFQFSISLILIIATVIVYRQLNYIQTTNVGFQKDQVLIIKGTGALGESAWAFKNEILGMAGVKSATMTDFLPTDNFSRGDNIFSKDQVMTPENSFNIQNWFVDYDYLATLGIELKAGRNFSKAFGSDSTAIIINEVFAKKLGYKDPVGKQIYLNDKKSVFTIIGILKNFNFTNFHTEIGPLGFFLGKNNTTTSFKISSKNGQEIVKKVEAKWHEMAPGMPFNYSFLDENFNQMYQSEQRIGKVALAFGILTVLIACLGLFGLVTYMTEQRIKEIGVRKVLGASVPNIVALLSKDFLKLVGIAILIASPIAYYFMQKWLQDFAYRINIEWWVFASAGVLAVLIAFLTVGYQAIKAALMNPVKSLKSE